MAEYDVLVSKADFKFHCAHFIAFKGFRERLHGHNYQVGVRVTGDGYVQHDGYLIDFGDIKKAVRSICKSMNEHFICPMKSDALVITEAGGTLCLECEDGAKFSFPTTDCLQLPIVHSSAEEMAHYIFCKVIRTIGLPYMHGRNIKMMEVSVSEATNQTATYRRALPQNEEEFQALESHTSISRPRPCCENNDD